jgi:hypothetical protein
MLQWKSFGFAGILAPQHLNHFFRLLALSGYLSISELVYRYKTRDLPSNSQVAKMNQEFKSYKHRAELQPLAVDVANLPAQEKRTARQQLSGKKMSDDQELSVIG